MLITASELRRINMARVLAEIRRSPGISRRQLSRRINFTDASLSRITKDLIGAEMIVEREERARVASRGRPNIGLHINPHGFTLLTVVITGYERKFSVVSLDGARLLEGDLPRPEGAEDLAAERAGGGAGNLSLSASLSAAIVREIDARLRADLSAPDHPPLALSAACVAASDEAETLAAEIERFFGVPVRRESVTAALHVAEAKCYAKQEIERSLLVHAGLDLGASLIIEGDPTGTTAVEQSLGGVAVAAAGEKGGEEGDGATGRAWRRIADESSGLAILRRLGHETPLGAGGSEAGLRLGVPHAVRQANAGDRRAVAAFAEAGRRLGLSLAALAALTRPERIFLAGPLAQARPYFEGFREPILASLGIAAEAGEEMLQRSRISYLQAAEASGLQGFVFSNVGENALAPRSEP